MGRSVNEEIILIIIITANESRGTVRCRWREREREETWFVRLGEEGRNYEKCELKGAVCHPFKIARVGSTTTTTKTIVNEETGTIHIG